jgi:formyltetrahydrofolate deformylase
MDLIATLKCTDQPGIVHAMTKAVLACGGNIIENQQFTDLETNIFVMRTRFESNLDLAAATTTWHTELDKFNPDLSLRPTEQPLKVLIMVSKESHCLRDLMYLRELEELNIEIPVVVSNHETLRNLVESHNLKFEYIPTSNKAQAEEQLSELIVKHEIDFVVLARYMQVLSSEFCNNHAGKIINIHHSFLPGFKGAKPYHQARQRGVKIIGATAHFVTADLDEGPIIEQDVDHITHAATAEDMIALGRDIERRVLSRAVKLYAEDKIFLVGNRTVVFS